MSFKDDLYFEKNCYSYIIKPLLNHKKLDTIFIRYNEDINKKSLDLDFLQKEKDIDVIIDDGKKNITISLKATRNIYDNIFFEIIKNSNTRKEGWGFYSKADYIFYLMTNINDRPFKKWICDIDSFWKLIIFKISDILCLDLSVYKDGVGKTFHKNNLLYETIGKLIPICDFVNKVIIKNDI